MEEVSLNDTQEHVLDVEMEIWFNHLTDIEEPGEEVSHTNTQELVEIMKENHDGLLLDVEIETQIDHLVDRQEPWKFFWEGLTIVMQLYKENENLTEV